MNYEAQGKASSLKLDPLSDDEIKPTSNVADL